MSRVTHYRAVPIGYTACSKDNPRLIVTDVEADVTCSNCKKGARSAGHRSEPRTHAAQPDL